MMRNLGGSIGIAALATLLTRGSNHSNRLGDAVSLYNLETQQRIDQLTQFFVSRGRIQYGSKAGDCVHQQYRPPRSLCEFTTIVLLIGIALLLRDCRYFLQTSQGKRVLPPIDRLGFGELAAT